MALLTPTKSTGRVQDGLWAFSRHELAEMLVEERERCRIEERRRREVEEELGRMRNRYEAREDTAVNLLARQA
jgi:hypothetical protein